jgi:hypothetical protein
MSSANSRVFLVSSAHLSGGGGGGVRDTRKHTRKDRRGGKRGEERQGQGKERIPIGKSETTDHPNRTLSSSNGEDGLQKSCEFAVTVRDVRGMDSCCVLRIQRMNHTAKREERLIDSTTLFDSLATGTSQTNRL